jgi:predicted metal-dependent hydrolase
METAISLFNRQAFFECHEVLEDLWRPLPAGPEKTFLQGLLQVGVGFYHWQRGNPVGARNKLRSGLEKLEVVAAQNHYQPPVSLLELISASQLLLNRLLEQQGNNLPDFPDELIPKLELA